MSSPNNNQNKAANMDNDMKGSASSSHSRSSQGRSSSRTNTTDPSSPIFSLQRVATMGGLAPPPLPSSIMMAPVGSTVAPQAPQEPMTFGRLQNIIQDVLELLEDDDFSDFGDDGSDMDMAMDWTSSNGLLAQ